MGHGGHGGEIFIYSRPRLFPAAPCHCWQNIWGESLYFFSRQCQTGGHEIWTNINIPMSILGFCFLYSQDATARSAGRERRPTPVGTCELPYFGISLRSMRSMKPFLSLEFFNWGIRVSAVLLPGIPNHANGLRLDLAPFREL